MTSSGEILKKFYAAVVKRDMAAAHGYLADDLVFVGLFETYRNADEYIAALTGLQVTVRLDVKTIIAEGNDAAVFFELETKAPAEATVLVAEWYRFKNGKITHIASAFHGRPYAAMFAGKTKARIIVKAQIGTARHAYDASLCRVHRKGRRTKPTKQFT